MYEVIFGVNILLDNFIVMEWNKNKIEELIQLIKGVVNDSFDILYMFVDFVVCKVEIIIIYFSKLVFRFIVLVNNFMGVVVSQNEIVYEI